jgi:hypothetical protein
LWLLRGYGSRSVGELGWGLEVRCLTVALTGIVLVSELLELSERLLRRL